MEERIIRSIYKSIYKAFTDIFPTYCLHCSQRLNIWIYCNMASTLKSDDSFSSTGDLNKNKHKENFHRKWKSNDRWLFLSFDFSQPAINFLLFLLFLNIWYIHLSFFKCDANSYLPTHSQSVRHRNLQIKMFLQPCLPLLLIGLDVFACRQKVKVVVVKLHYKRAFGPWAAQLYSNVGGDFSPILKTWILDRLLLEYVWPFTLFSLPC